MKAYFYVLLLFGMGIGDTWLTAEEPAANGNLLSNAAFADGLQGWKTESWNQTGSAAIDNVEQFHGRPSLKIENTSEGETSVSQSVVVKPKTKYRLRGFIKTKNLLAKSGGAGASISVVHSGQRTKDLYEDSDWTNVSCEFETGDKTEIELGPRLGSAIKVKGTAWFAELAFECLESGSSPPAPVKPAAPSPPAIRTFVDVTGRSLRGQLIAIKDDQVTIKREDGQNFTLKASTFSPADVAYLKANGLAEPKAPAPPPPAGEPASSATHRDNLLTNGSFEKGIEGWTFHADHSHGEAAWDEAEKHEGKPTVRIQNGSVDSSHFTQKVTVKQSTRYRLSGYIKSKGLQPEKQKGKYGACLVAGSTKTPSVLGTKSWTKVTIDFDTFHETEIDVGPHVGDFFDLESGTAWFSDLSLVEIGKARK